MRTQSSELMDASISLMVFPVNGCTKSTTHLGAESSTRSDVAHRLEDEAALLQTLVRNHEIVESFHLIDVDHVVSIKQDI